MKPLHLVLPVLACCSTLLAAEAAPAGAPQLLSVKKIWDAAPHNAFTDLCRFNGSSHEGRTSIYLAKVRLPGQKPGGS